MITKEKIEDRLKEKFLARINELIIKAADVIQTQKKNPPKVFATVRVDSQNFASWRMSCLNLISSLPIQENYFMNEFTEKVKDSTLPATQRGLGILEGLKEEIEKDFLISPVDIVQAEVFTDFLDMAEYLLENGYIDPAVFLTGAVLEIELRNLCKKNNIPVKISDDNISSLNQKLFQKSVYNKIVFKQVDQWNAIRSQADHGHFKEYTEDQVKDFLEGVKKFIDNLAHKMQKDNL